MYTSKLLYKVAKFYCNLMTLIETVKIAKTKKSIKARTADKNTLARKM